MSGSSLGPCCTAGPSPACLAVRGKASVGPAWVSLPLSAGWPGCPGGRLKPRDLAATGRPPAGSLWGLVGLAPQQICSSWDSPVLCLPRDRVPGGGVCTGRHEVEVCSCSLRGSGERSVRPPSSSSGPLPPCYRPRGREPRFPRRVHAVMLGPSPIPTCARTSPSHRQSWRPGTLESSPDFGV